MRTFFTKYKIWIWVVLLLITLNVTVIATLLYRMNSGRRLLQRPPAEMNYQRPGQGIYLRNELNMSDEQYNKFIASRLKYQKRAMEINQQLSETKKEYWNEVMKSKPDKAIIQANCDSIGAIHMRMIRERTKYYNEIKKICNDKQVDKLNTFFMQAAQTDENTLLRNPARRSIGRPGGPMRNNQNRNNRYK
jgi:hypothetical protein